MKSEGRLHEDDFPDILQDLSRQRWTGLLRLERGEERIGITIEDGHLVFASTSNTDYRLGPRLLRRGVITLRQIEDAGRGMTQGKRFGTVLVEMGYLEPKELVRGVVDQTRDIILLAFHWTSGTYRLDPEPAAGEAMTLGHMSTPQLILDGLSQIEASSRVERGSGGLVDDETRDIYRDRIIPFWKGKTIREKIFGPDHAEVAGTLNSLGAIAYREGDLKKAGEIWERTLAIREKTLGPDHPYLAQTLNNLAIVYNYTGDPKRAVPLLQRVVQIQEKVLGPKHPDLASGLMNLGDAVYRVESPAGAKPYYARAVAIMEAASPENPELAGFLDRLAAVILMEKDGMPGSAGLSVQPAGGSTRAESLSARAHGSLKAA